MNRLLWLSLLFITGSCTTYFVSSNFGVIAQEPTLKKALAAPAWDLAHGYLWVKNTLQLFSVVDAGATIQLQGETINKINVVEYQGRYKKRLTIYIKAIKQRGYKTISGAYKGETTESCARIQSPWVSIIHNRLQSEIEIRQDGIDAQVILRGKQDGKQVSLKIQSAIAESFISLVDTMNSDYFFRGETKDQGIVIKPNLSVLDTWSGWANPPNPRDLKNCTITLKLLSRR